MSASVHPNWFAYLALLIWPMVAVHLYSRLPIGRATLWTILGGFLLLPVGAVIKFDHVPGFDKDSIPNLSALIGCALNARRLPKFAWGFGLPEFLILLSFVGPFVTSVLNTDPIRVGEIVLPGIGAYEALAVAVTQLIFVLPFFLGRQFLRSSDDNVEILLVMTIAGLAYSLLMLFEVRMSPQLHTWIYGYAPSAMITAIRDGGFRPVVFLPNGLWVAFFATTAVVSACALWRTKNRIGRLQSGWIAGYLIFVLVLCKTRSAFVYGALLVPLVRWASPRVQLRVACVLATLALGYPALRIADLVPTNSILEITNIVSPDHTGSLKVRFDQERQLLDRAWERPWFGWGRFGRSRLYDESGSDISISDGYWVITLGEFGLVGFLAQFGLLALVVYRAAMALKFAQIKPDTVHLAALALIVAINMIDLLPNSSISPWTWLLAGALVGRAEELRAMSNQRIRFGERRLQIGSSAS
jgi:hypothetical protein